MFRSATANSQTLILMGAIKSGYTSMLRKTKVERKRSEKILYYIYGQNVCRDVFCAYYGTSRRRITIISQKLRSTGFYSPTNEKNQCDESDSPSLNI